MNGDETWVHFYDSASKEYSNQWYGFQRFAMDASAVDLVFTFCWIGFLNQSAMVVSTW